MTTIANIDNLLKKLELDAPDVYIKCIAFIPDKKGIEREKKCILNLKTGDVFKNRKLQKSEEFNHRIVRRHSQNGVPEIAHFAHQTAQIVEDQIVLTTWIFGDYINQPGTAQLDFSWYGDTSVDGAPRTNTVDSNALLGIVVSKPAIASVVTVSKDKTIGIWNDVDKYGPIKWNINGLRAEYLSTSLFRSLHSSYDVKNVANLTECFKKFFEIGYVGANRYLTFDAHKDVATFMNTPPMQINTGKKQKIIDELTSIPIPDHTVVPMTEKVICYADRVNKEWTALRWWMQVGPAKYVETSRLYVNKTEAFHCRSNLAGRWVHAAAKLKAETFQADRVILQYPCVLDGTKLEYFKNISTEMSNQSAALYMLTMYDEFEKMYKAGLDWICDAYLTKPWQQSWKNYLDSVVGRVDWSAKNVLKMIGVNRHQIEKINEWRTKTLPQCRKARYGYWSTCSVDSIIGKMRRVFGTTPMSDIDNETFDYILDSVNYERLMGMYLPAIQKTFELYHKDAMYFIRDLNTVDPTGAWTISTVTECGYTAQMNIDRLYFDTLNMVRLGGYTDRIRPRFSTADELIGHHQILVDLTNADRAEQEAKINARYESAFQTHNKRWKKWEWDGDDMEFCVIAPSKPVDVAVEGVTLRHCVKSYIPSVSAGTTNIMFIRRKGKEDEPFFTVEVDTTNSIRQVHGMCNCNVSSVEGLTEFVKKWSKLKKLRYDEHFANGRRVAG